MHRSRIALDQGEVEYVDTGGSGPVIVLLHGALMDEHLWDAVAAALAPRLRCIVPILPLGAHRLPMPKDADLSPGGVARLVTDLLDALDLDDVTLVGNDTGGAIAQLMIRSAPRRVTRLALISCDAFDNFPPGLPGRTMALACRMPGGLWFAVQSLRVRGLRRLPMTYGWMTKRPIDDTAFTRWLHAFRADRRVRADIARFMRGVDRRQLTSAAARFREFCGQTLIVWAAEDKVMPLAHADRLAAAFGSARIELIQDSYTLIPVDQPAKLARLLADFVAEGPQPDESPSAYANERSHGYARATTISAARSARFGADTTITPRRSTPWRP